MEEEINPNGFIFIIKIRRKIKMAKGEKLREVQRIAKELRLKNPGLKHTEAVSLAWKEIKK